MSTKVVSFRLTRGGQSRLIQYLVNWWNDQLIVDGVVIPGKDRESKAFGEFLWHGYRFQVGFAKVELHCDLAVRGFMSLSAAALAVDDVIVAEAGQAMPDAVRQKLQAL
jgi:hypothetical protein